MTNDMNAWNTKIIEEFRANKGQAGGDFAGASLLLLHTTGAKSGAERINPVMYQSVGQSWAVFASKGGAPTNPDWYHNLLANPKASIEVGTETVRVTARVATSAEREQIWSKQKQERPQFAEYEASTKRVIPVVVLERAG